MLAALFLILALNYFLFIFRGKTEKVMTEFGVLTASEKRKYKIVSTVYFIFIIMIFIASVILFVT